MEKSFNPKSAEKLLTDQGRPLGLQFISTNNENMPWTFEPSEEVMTISTGQYYTATFYVKNTTNRKMTAQAVPKCSPIKCSCTSKKARVFLF
jgi:cytochrome c oxidase assembly protein subunit 11